MPATRPDPSGRQTSMNGSTQARDATNPLRKLIREARLATRVPMFEVFHLFDKGNLMYKNPELSAMAKTLVAELAADGITLKHTKALSIAAKMMSARNLHTYQASSHKTTTAPAVAGEETLFQGAIHDWNLKEAQLEGYATPLQARTFEARVQKSGDQFFIDIALPHTNPSEIDDTDQLSLFIEIHEGRPRVLINNQLYGDQVLGVYGLAGGLLLEPMQYSGAICSGYPNEPSLLALYQEEQQKTPRGHTLNWMFMEQPNRSNAN